MDEELLDRLDALIIMTQRLYDVQMAMLRHHKPLLHGVLENVHEAGGLMYPNIVYVEGVENHDDTSEDDTRL